MISGYGRKALEINKELVVSTSHVTKQTMDWLGGAEVSGYEAFDLPGGDKVEYGHLVYTETDPYSLPPDLRAMVDLANANECKWLRLDCDGFTVDGFPTYDW
jgi:hypothetical protein